MLESLKSWLAGDAPVEAGSTRFEFGVPLPAALGVLLIIALAVAAAIYTWRRLGKLNSPPRTAVTTLRAAALALAFFMLLDPCIVGEKIKPGKHFVVSLFDDSKSMRIIGDDGLSRGQRLQKTYETAGPELEKALKQRYQLADYRFGSGVERIQNPASLDFQARESDINGAIRDSLRDLDGVEVSAVILYTDGIQQTSKPTAELKELMKSRVPVFTVGVDTESQWRDIELGKVSVSRTEFDRSPIVMTVPVMATRLAGSDAIVEVILDGHVEKSERITIKSDNQEQVVRLEFVPQKKGWLELNARVRLAETGGAEKTTPVEDIVVPGKDRVIQNNSRRLTFDNRQKEYKILYFCGRPNWENKFVRRALEDDDQLKLTSLLRISRAEKKFVFRGKQKTTLSNPLFQGLEGAQDQPRYDESVFLRFGTKGTELDKGYPTTPDEIFPYQLVIWGDIEQEFFSRTHLELTRDFVAKRGGTLLLLGGPHSFSEGDYNGTVIANMLPTILGEPTHGKQEPENLKEAFNAHPTVEGILTGAFSLDPNPQENEKLWGSMPALSGINLFPLTRPGARVMAEATGSSEKIKNVPLVAMQRYGEGRCAVLATNATWQWQLGLDKDDQRHERLWRQFIRSLVTGVQESVMLREKADSYTVGDPAKFQFLVRDSVFDEREGLQTTVRVKAPSGKDLNLAVDESIQEAGVYKTEFVPEEPGTHILSLTSMNDKGEVVGTTEEAFLAEPDQREFQKAEYNPAFLRDLAEKTGGKFVTLDHITDIAKNIPWVDRTQPEEMRIHLWRLPLFFVTLVGILSAEWLIRRLKGYA